MQAQRAKLPMAGMRQQLADTLATADAVVVSGETGSGKTTQVCDLVLLFGVILVPAGAVCTLINRPRDVTKTYCLPLLHPLVMFCHSGWISWWFFGDVFWLKHCVCE